MGNNQTDRTLSDAQTSSDDAPGAGKTRQLVRSVFGAGAKEHARLYEEVVRTNPGKGYDPSELVELSVKISPRGFSQQRYGAPLSWEPSQREQFSESVRNAAPTELLSAALSPSAPEGTGGAVEEKTPAERARADKRAKLRSFVQRTSRYFSCLAYDLDAGLYKMYLFKHRPVHFFEEVDLVGRFAELTSLSYIRSLEVKLDDETAFFEPVYFKLRFTKPAKDPTAAVTTDESLAQKMQPEEVLSPDFTPHPLFSPRLLSLAENREKIAEHLRTLLAGLVTPNDPVVKFVPPALQDSAGPARAVSAEDFRALDYGVNLNLLDKQRIRFIEDHSAAILGVAEAFSCRRQAEAWLAQVRPFDCCLSYLGIGSDSVTFYYRSTTMHRGKPAPHFLRNRERADKNS